MINCKKIEFFAYLILISDKNKVVVQINAKFHLDCDISLTVGQKYLDFRQKYFTQRKS